MVTLMCVSICWNSSVQPGETIGFEPTFCTNGKTDKDRNHHDSVVGGVGEFHRPMPRGPATRAATESTMDEVSGLSASANPGN